MRTNRLAIIGLGLIGASLAKSIKHSYPKIEIAAFDYHEILELALKEKNIDKDLSDFHEALNYEFIFLALPIELSLKVFKELSPLLKKDQVISDLCSVKGIFADEWTATNSKGIYIGTHPMTGKEKGGYENSDNLLFENAVFIISEHCKHFETLSDFTDIIKSIGARITFLDPYLHDEIVSKVSHLPQLLSVLLVNQAATNKNGIQFIDFAAGGFRDMTRIASSDFKIWESILKYNKQKILNSLESFQKELESLRALIVEEKSDSIGVLFNKARTLRDETSINNKGFLVPLFDITVFIKDEPGMISKISTVLFENKINIKDIELLKIREGTGGNFKLYFESKSEAERAKGILESIGFKLA
jgi:prephenate dehydrogenase